MTKEMMKQCLLRDATGGQEVCWIESSLAVKGRPLRIKVDGKWEDGWAVTEVLGDFELAQSYLQERSRDHKSHRKATDV